MIFSIRSIECMYKALGILNKKNENYAHLYKEIVVSHETLQNVLKYVLSEKLVLQRLVRF